MILIIFRACLAPIILVMSYLYREESRMIVLILMYLGLFSDIFDGIIARELKLNTSMIRRLDSQADMIFWVSIGVATWILYPNLIRKNYIPIIIIFIMEASCYMISIIKFRRETCTHAFLSKLWGITLLIAFTSLIGFNHVGIPFVLAITFGLISHVDRILITIILKEWAHDIPGFYHAYLVRKGITFKKYKLLN